jgi:peptide/nickel transport system substrate-binding protein
VTDKSGVKLAKNPFKDARVRRAFSKAINRQAIVERVMEGLAVPAGQLMPDGFFGVSSDLKPEPYDPEGAKKLLAQAGYADGFMMTLHGPNNRYVNNERIVQAIAGMLARVGILAEVQVMPMSVYLPRASRREFSAALLGWGVISGEGTNPLRALTATPDAVKGWGNFNWGGYSNPKADAFLEEALATIDNAKRDRLIQQATELVINDCALIPLHFQVNTWAAQKPITYEPRTDGRTDAYVVRAGK